MWLKPATTHHQKNSGVEVDLVLLWSAYADNRIIMFDTTGEVSFEKQFLSSASIFV